jgi:hypothetical protein
MSTPVIKLCPKLILEGTRLTGKTDLVLALNENPRIVGFRKYRYHSPVISAEWNGFCKNPYGSSLIDFEEKYATRAMEAYRIWLSVFELYRYYSWIIDRFHISTQMWQAVGVPFGCARISADILLATPGFFCGSAQTAPADLQQPFAVRRSDDFHSGTADHRGADSELDYSEPVSRRHRTINRRPSWLHRGLAGSNRRSQPCRIAPKSKKQAWSSQRATGPIGIG